MILQDGSWWPTLNKDYKTQLKKCDKCQRLDRPLKQHELPLMSINLSMTFEIWAIVFVGLFPKPGHRTGSRYIIIDVEYVTNWAEVEPIESFTKVVATKFICENTITYFGFPITLINDRGTHFINQTIDMLMKE